MLSPIAASWISEEFFALDLGDPRRETRFKHILSTMCACPSVSIPVMSGDHTNAVAAYRFLHNEAVDLDNVPECHIEQTLLRASSESILLAVQDTTQMDFTSHPKTKGLGPLQTQKQQGMLLHSTLAVSERGVPYGFLDQNLWARPKGDFGKSEFRSQRALQDKESQKWLNGLMATQSFNAIVPGVTLVHVADREADIFDFLAMERSKKQHILVRAHHNRALSNEEQKLWPFLAAQAAQGEMTVQLPGGHGKSARQATLTVRFSEVELKAPHTSNSEVRSLRVSAVLAREESGPDRIGWMLLSTLPVENLDQAIQRVRWYSCRWRIEMFHRILKSGCKVQDCRLEDIESLKRYIVMQSLVAWRVLYCMTTAREYPDWPCTSLLDEKEWQVLYLYTFKKQKKALPEKPPSLADATKWIAQMGGFLGRKGDGHPGMQSLQRGFERLAYVVEAYTIFSENKT